MRSALPSRLEPAAEMSRHRHVAAYATLVLSGGYEEAGDAGRFRVSEGDVLIHSPFSAHRDAISRTGAIVLDLPLPFDGRDWASRGRIADPDALVRSAAWNASEAATELLLQIEPHTSAETDLPDILARDLVSDPQLAIGAWAEQQNVSRETVWRHFTSAYGADIATFRGEARARNAWRLIVRSPAPLAEIAATTGFSDQPHMSRAIKALTGRPPGAWRQISA
jgi:AraC-like DNA-binding protein